MLPLSRQGPSDWRRRLQKQEQGESRLPLSCSTTPSHPLHVESLKTLSSQPNQSANVPLEEKRPQRLTIWWQVSGSCR